MSTALVLSARRGQCGQRPTSIGRVLYVERLTAGSTAAARKCLLITRKIIIPPPDSRDPPDRPPYYAQKNEYPRLAGTHLSGRLTCGPTKLTGTKGFVNLVNMNDSSSSDRTMSIQRPWCFFNLWSCCSSRPKQHWSCRLLLPQVAGCAAVEASSPPTTPTASQALRRRQPHTAAEPVNPRTPLRVGIHCRVFPGSATSPS